MYSLDTCLRVMSACIAACISLVLARSTIPLVNDIEPVHQGGVEAHISPVETFTDHPCASLPGELHDRAGLGPSHGMRRHAGRLVHGQEMLILEKHGHLIHGPQVGLSPPFDGDPLTGAQARGG